jgi:hypothetical protein
MAQARQSSSWPTAGDRNIKCTLQYSTPTTDAMGGRSEPTWSTFGSWWAKVIVVPIVPNETDSVLLYEVEGPYRSDVLDYFIGGTGLRVTTPTLTLKVFQVENPQLRNRTLRLHCANAVNTQ